MPISFKRKSKKHQSCWELQPGDLPSEDVTRKEPRLAGMEDNAVFRITLAERRIEARIAAGGSILRSNDSKRGSLSDAFGARLGELKDRRLKDLIAAGTPPHEFILGLWGLNYRQKPKKIEMMVMTGLTPIATVILFMPDPAFGFAGVGWCFIYAIYLAAQKYYPLTGLQFACGIIEAQHRNITRRLPIKAILKGLAILGIVTLIIAAGVMGIVLLEIDLSRLIPTTRPKIAPSSVKSFFNERPILTFTLMRTTWMFFAVFLGYLFGRDYGARINSDELMAKAEKQIAMILDKHRARLFDGK